MKININYEDEAFRKDEYEQVIERVCDEAALVYGLGPNAEISILESTSTTVVESPMPSPLIAEDVTASVGHIPSIRTKVGFSLMSPLYKRSTFLFID